MFCDLCFQEIVGTPIIADLPSFKFLCGECYIRVERMRMFLLYNYVRSQMSNGHERSYSLRIPCGYAIPPKRQPLRLPYQLELFSF